MFEYNKKYKERIKKSASKMQIDKIGIIKKNNNDAISQRFMIESELSRLRNRGRPYHPHNHFTRQELNNIRDNELKKINDKLN